LLACKKGKGKEKPAVRAAGVLSQHKTSTKRKEGGQHLAQNETTRMGKRRNTLEKNRGKKRKFPVPDESELGDRNMAAKIRSLSQSKSGGTM